MLGALAFTMGCATKTMDSASSESRSKAKNEADEEVVVGSRFARKTDGGKTPGVKTISNTSIKDEMRNRIESQKIGE
jgi:hypothetical protein